MASTAEQTTQTPSQIGTRYTVIEQLGRGGMAIAYRALDTGRGAEVALKQLMVPEDPDRRRKINALFEREFYVLAQLAHPSIVQVYDFGLDAAGPYYTMELLDGGDLDSLAPLPYRTCCEIALQVASALSLLHSRKFIHRDISPRNVRCTRNGRAKLIDFGAMIPMGPCRQVVGTPAFTAPEAIHGISLDARTDLFSLGATLYFALTGRPPFAARVFDDLREAWRQQPLAPSQIAPDVPAELDALVLGLLRVDPSHRPRSAFEIMQRLAAIAGLQNVEAEDISQAYLQTPTLVGRDEELQRFRASAKRTLEGRGGGVWIDGPAGSGRSRLLDAWVLDAKTLGLLVARTAGGSGESAPFTSAYELAEQLTALLPDAIEKAARDAGVYEHLFIANDASPGRPQLAPLAKLRAERDRLPQWLTRLFEEACREHSLLIVADDAERIDDASLALLAALAHGGVKRRLLVAAAVSSQVAAATQPALDVLASHCARSTLAPLTAAETEALFSSVFGRVPHVAVVSDRIQAVSMGNPGAAMAVAQHMLDTELVRYSEGSWLLPAEVTLTELPADAEHLLRARLANLSPLAHRLGELQALAIASTFTRADYAELAGAGEAKHVDAALDSLLRLGVLSSDGVSYTIAHDGDRALLLAALTQERETAHHLVLADHFAATSRPIIAEVHHLLLAGADERALDRLTVVLQQIPDRGDFIASFGLNGHDVGATLERAFEAARLAGRPVRQICEIARMLVTLSVVTDNKLHTRYGPVLAAHLTRDSGLDQYRKLDPQLPAGERLKLTFEAAAARHAATPERDRSYRPDEAIRHLASYVTISIAIGARTRDTRLLHSITDMLEPYAPLSPLLYALWQNAISAPEMNVDALTERARERALHVYERLGECKGPEQAYAGRVRSAVATAMAFLESGLGLTSVGRWLSEIENDPMQCVNAAHLRRLACIVEGDTEGAEAHRQRAEVLALQSSTRQMFVPPVRLELTLQVRVGDLAGVKQVADQIARLAEHEPGWVAQHLCALGHYERMRGDLATAEDAFSRAIAASGVGSTDPPPDHHSWVVAVAGYVGVLSARGRVAEACRIGRDALEHCKKHGIDAAAWDLVRELAVAEAKMGDHEIASQRLDALIAAREDANPAHRIVDFEARARVAIETKDRASAERFIQLLAQHGRADAGNVLLPRHMQLSDDARRAGVALQLPETIFQTQVLAPRMNTSRETATTMVATAFAEAVDASDRAGRALSLLCEAAGDVSGGQLYLADESGLYLAASQVLTQDDELDARVRSYWRQLAHDDDSTAVMTTTQDGDDPKTEVWQVHGGSRCRPIVLRSLTPDGPRCVGVALLASPNATPLEPQVWELAAVLSARLLELGDASGARLD